MDLHIYRNSNDRWHDLRAAARSSGGVLAFNALTLEELVQRLTPELVAASPAQRLVLIRQAAPDTPARYAYDAISELKAAGVRGADLRKAGSPGLADAIESYNALLAKHKLTDPQDRRWLAASRVPEAHWLRRFRSVVLHALYDLSDAEFALLHNLIGCLPDGGTVQIFNATANIKPTQFAEWTWRRFIRDEALAEKTFPDFLRPSGPAQRLIERLFVFEAGNAPSERLAPSNALRVLQCSGRYQEIEAIGAEIAGLLAEGVDPSEIAVVVRHIEMYGEMIEDVFTRYGINHAFETGVPLLRIPFIKYWISFLELVDGYRPRNAFARTLSSAYYEPRLTPALDPARILADIGYIDRRHLKASALAARRHSPLTEVIERFESVLDDLEGTLAARPMEFVERLEPRGPLTDRDRLAWRTLFEEIQAVDALAGPIPFAAFRSMVAEIASLRTVDRFSGRIVPPGPGRIRVMPPHALGYRPYGWIFAPGFADGEIPAAAPSSPLLPDEVLDVLNKAIQPRRVMNARDRNRREPLHLFMILDSATDQVVLTCPGSTLEGISIYPSIYISEILRHYHPSPLSEPPRGTPREIGECFREIARAWRSDEIDDAAAAVLLDTDIVRRARWEKRGTARADLGSGALQTNKQWHPSELDALADCPFVFFARYPLGIREHGQPDFEVPASEVGTLAHRILREFYAEPVPASEAVALDRMNDIIARQLAQVDVDGQGPRSVIDPTLWRIRRPQLIRALLEYVRFAVRDAAAGYHTLPQYLDQPLPEAALGRVRLGGRPDHVAARYTDGRLTGIRIDDFKYSAASSQITQQLRQSFQIPVYAYLAATVLGADAGVPIEGRYLLLRSPSTPVVAVAVDAPVVESIRVQIEALLGKVRSGHMHPDPVAKQDCRSCDYRRLCRMYGG